MNDVIYIGIDPAFRSKGLGVCYLDGSKVFFQSHSMRDFLQVLFTHDLSNWVVCIENSNLTNATFNPSGSLPVKLKKSRDVGKNQAVSQIIFDICKQRCLKVIEVSPKQKGAKWKSDNIVKAIAKQEGHQLNKKKLNQDDRDSYKILLLGKKYFQSFVKVK